MKSTDEKDRLGGENNHYEIVLRNDSKEIKIDKHMSEMKNMLIFMDTDMST